MKEQILDEKGSSYYLLLCTVRGIVEKHGGSMKLDANTNTFVLGIPHSRKMQCVEELQHVIGPLESFDDFFPFFAFDSRH